MLATVRAAEKLGAGVIAGCTGSPVWPGVAALPPPSAAYFDEGLKTFARLWTPILDACRDANIKFALEVQPGQIAFDIASADQALNAVGGRDELGFAFDPSALHWQGVDPVEFLRRFPQRIYHVHVRDAALTLQGQSGILCSYLPAGHPGRGWNPRSPGHGGIDWEGVIRALHTAGYDGPLAIDWEDPHMERDFGAEDACKFVKRLDFPAARAKKSDAFD
jgi:sugar phosphate isomerase/epimerase